MLLRTTSSVRPGARLCPTRCRRAGPRWCSTLTPVTTRPNDNLIRLLRLRAPSRRTSRRLLVAENLDDRHIHFVWRMPRSGRARGAAVRRRPVPPAPCAHPPVSQRQRKAWPSGRHYLMEASGQPRSAWGAAGSPGDFGGGTLPPSGRRTTEMLPRSSPSSSPEISIGQRSSVNWRRVVARVSARGKQSAQRCQP